MAAAGDEWTHNEARRRFAATIEAWCGMRPGAFQGAHPVSLTRQNAPLLGARGGEFPLAEHYRASYKPDGTRMMLLVCDGGAVFFDRTVEPFRPVACALPPGTLLDGEWVVGAAGSPTPAPERAGAREAQQPPPRGRHGDVYLVFDALCVGGVDVRALPYGARYEAARAVVAAQPRDAPGPRVEMKPLYALASLRRLVAEVVPALPYPCDGLIFADVTQPYAAGRDTALLKWKDAHTVDACVRLDPADPARAHEPGTLRGATLVVRERVHERWRDVTYARLADAGALEDGCIGEFLVTGGVPVLVRVRTDKRYPNDADTVAGVLAAWRDAVSSDELCALVDAALGLGGEPGGPSQEGGEAEKMA